MKPLYQCLYLAEGQATTTPSFSVDAFVKAEGNMKSVSRLTALTALIVSAMLSHAEAQWLTHEFRDSFGRGTPAIISNANSNINNRGRPEFGRAMLVIRPADAYVMTGDIFICHSPPSNPVRLSLQVDGGRVLDTQGANVSTDKRAIFLGQAALNMILGARREIKMAAGHLPSRRAQPNLGRDFSLFSGRRSIHPSKPRRLISAATRPLSSSAAR
jgi:hypothetical protein